jgi:hypothetical protein
MESTVLFTEYVKNSQTLTLKNGFTSGSVVPDNGSCSGRLINSGRMTYYGSGPETLYFSRYADGFAHNDSTKIFKAPSFSKDQ